MATRTQPTAAAGTYTTELACLAPLADIDIAMPILNVVGRGSGRPLADLRTGFAVGATVQDATTVGPAG